MGSKIEKKLWERGVGDWQDFLKSSCVVGFSLKRKLECNEVLREALKALREEDIGYFACKWPSCEMWRCYDYFKDDCCFLDVEVDSRQEVIVVGISNYYQTRSFVKGFNLTRDALVCELEKYKLLVTFNGSSFDLPLIFKQFEIAMWLPHFDLKGVCARAGLCGGLKEIEKVLDLKRPGHLYGNPIDLWRTFKASGDQEYLELLLAYNREDVENLKGICDYAYGVLKRKAGEYKSFSKI